MARGYRSWARHAARTDAAKADAEQARQSPLAGDREYRVRAQPRQFIAIGALAAIGLFNLGFSRHLWVQVGGIGIIAFAVALVGVVILHAALDSRFRVTDSEFHAPRLVNAPFGRLTSRKATPLEACMFEGENFGIPRLWVNGRPINLKWMSKRDAEELVDVVMHRWTTLDRVRVGPPRYVVSRMFRHRKPWEGQRWRP